ncbi:hypothetical protein B0J13DRAFT_534484 [Dactylonectria estremocensis]|uniref:Extracellular membrane protein CFEM domain-containing protein n=1 Tax=Dactylonectria estremocensis TaxID=1079267 RepID=A0A9P9D1N5_9HYPO|nr:hypothetical protein B0J13DRAFT_534484 [Dactylonectria estremocensis]
MALAAIFSALTFVLLEAALVSSQSTTAVGIWLEGADYCTALLSSDVADMFGSSAYSCIESVYTSFIAAQPSCEAAFDSVEDDAEQEQNKCDCEYFLGPYTSCIESACSGTQLAAFLTAKASSIPCSVPTTLPTTQLTTQSTEQATEQATEQPTTTETPPGNLGRNMKVPIIGLVVSSILGVMLL